MCVWEMRHPLAFTDGGFPLLPLLVLLITFICGIYTIRRAETARVLPRDALALRV
jgi:hypothetical protein